MELKHMDEIHIDAFRQFRAEAVEMVERVAAEIERNGVCPACFLHLIAEAARDVATRLEGRHDAKTH